jgi:hypothetical protein
MAPGLWQIPGRKPAALRAAWASSGKTDKARRPRTGALQGQADSSPRPMPSPHPGGRRSRGAAFPPGNLQTIRDLQFTSSAMSAPFEPLSPRGRGVGERGHGTGLLAGSGEEAGSLARCMGLFRQDRQSQAPEDGRSPGSGRFEPEANALAPPRRAPLPRRRSWQANECTKPRPVRPILQNPPTAAKNAAEVESAGQFMRSEGAPAESHMAHPTRRSALCARKIWRQTPIAPT